MSDAEIKRLEEGNVIQDEPRTTSSKKELLISELKKPEVMKPRSQDGTSTLCAKIQKVPCNMMVQNNKSSKNFYKPSEISIGPIHAQTTTLADNKASLKHRLAKCFLEYIRKKPEEVFSVVEENLAAIKECFEESVIKPFKDEDLASLLVLDACFVLQFIFSATRDQLSRFQISNGRQNVMQQDLFLLENQLPFLLLKLVIDCSVKKEKLMKAIETFIVMNVISPPDYYFKRDNHLHSKEENPVHLLHMLRSELLFSLNGLNHQESKICGSARQRFYRKSFRNVQDLKDVGIRLKASDRPSFRAVSFCTGWWFLSAELRLPAIIVDDSTVSKLQNLVAFEMCPDNNNCDFGVCSYLCLMDSLVDNVQDVRDLRAAHVLRNRLGSDKQVANLFNEIGPNLLTNDMYKAVKEKIQKHYENKLASWWAQVWEKYFSSPWNIIALIAGTFVLFFAGVSAYYAWFPHKHAK